MRVTCWMYFSGEGPTCLCMHLCTPDERWFASRQHLVITVAPPCAKRGGGKRASKRWTGRTPRRARSGVVYWASVSWNPNTDLNISFRYHDLTLRCTNQDYRFCIPGYCGAACVCVCVFHRSFNKHLPAPINPTFSNRQNQLVTPRARGLYKKRYVAIRGWCNGGIHGNLHELGDASRI